MNYKRLDRSISKTVLELIEKLCADYPRRKRIIECEFRTRTTDEAVLQFKKTNDTIDQALECVDKGLREYILSDIANHNGYDRSMASPYITKNSYYAQKNKAIYMMAVGFHLIF